MFWREIPYTEQGSEIFAAVADEPWSMFLDSGGAGGVRGRFDILLRAPRVRIWEQRGQVLVEEAPSQEPFCSAWPLMETLRRYCPGNKASGFSGLPAGVPFAGGVAGYLAYDWGHRHQGISHPGESLLPTAAFGLYEYALVLDHGRRVAGIWGDRQAHEDWGHLLSLPLHRPRDPFRLSRPGIVPLWTAEEYGSAFSAVEEYIRAGDCYQVNLAQCFSGHWQGSFWPLYQRLRERGAAPFSVSLNTPWGTLLSLSPERLLRLQDGELEARPIKGTRPRHADPVQDAAAAEELQQSRKDQAENVMIVDLLRNDLGQVAETGTVRVPELHALESFSQVHHLVSSIVARLDRNLDAWTALAACFPGGSVTGTPKIRAMEIIGELEAGSRGLYCGSAGYMDFRGNMDWNILIRSLELRADGSLYFWGGGAVVADSEVHAEYQESLDKVAFIQRTLNEFLAFSEELEEGTQESGGSAVLDRMVFLRGEVR